MKSCEYCGHENEDIAAFCHACGTKFPAPTPKPLPTLSVRTIPQPELLNLEKLPDVFTYEAGFSRPDWKQIGRAVEAFESKEDRAQAWGEAVFQWLQKLREVLGGEYHVRISGECLLLSALGEQTEKRLLDFSNRAIAEIRDFLGQVAWGSHTRTQVILIFNDADDYYQYLSWFYPEGEHPTSMGVFLSAGYPHIAIRFDSELRTIQTIAHEFAHACVRHLPLPRWLNEGLALTMHKAVGQDYVPAAHHGSAANYWGLVSGWSPPVVWDDLVQAHYRFWNEQRAQEFWAGTSFEQPGEAVELSYNLAEVLVHLLGKNRADFLCFIQNAQGEDAGQSAALDCLGTCLGETMGTFLGPGNWRPQRKIIKQCWEKQRITKEPGS